MKIAVVGLGYVGCTTGVCLANLGHEVFGVDINERQIELLQSGIAPFTETGLQDLLESDEVRRNFHATTDLKHAVASAEVILVCVGTPSKDSGEPDTKYLRKSFRDIGAFLKTSDEFKVVALRSTLLPGVAKEELLPMLAEESGKEPGEGFGFCVNPEFLREGTAIADFHKPPFTVVGVDCDRTAAVMEEMYSCLEGRIHRVGLEAASMIKYACNAFHALKVVFANEIGNVCQAHDIDGHEVMNVFVEDRDLNISPYYLKPGPPFGGSCLPKDLAALEAVAERKDIDIPMLSSIRKSNNLHLEKAFQLVRNSGKKNVGLVGLSFKAGTDDLRESIGVKLTDRLLEKNFNLSIYDPKVATAPRQNAMTQVTFNGGNGSRNNANLTGRGGFFSCLKTSLGDVIDDAEVLVVTQAIDPQETELLVKHVREDQIVIDLTRVDQEALSDLKGTYHGICW